MTKTNAASSIKLIKDIDPAKITYGQPKILENGGKIIPISYDKGEFITQLDSAVAPYGLSSYKTPSGEMKYSLSLSLGKTMVEKLTEVDNKVIKDAFESNWFKKKFSSIKATAMSFTHNVKHYEENGEISDKYPPTMKLQFPMVNGDPTCRVYDNARNLINLQNIDSKGASVISIAHCSGIWIVGDKFGTSWKAKQLLISQNNSKITGFSFLHDEDEEEEVDDDL